MSADNGTAAAPAPSPTINLGVPYAAALGLVLLILVYEGKARRRERRLLAQVEDAREMKRRANLRQREAEQAVEVNQRERAEAEKAAEGKVSLPSDALAIVTEGGQVCTAPGQDHQAGTHAREGWGGSPSSPKCETCAAYLKRFEDRPHPGQ